MVSEIAGEADHEYSQRMLLVQTPPRFCAVLPKHFGI
jgi:hypothetical protein